MEESTAAVNIQNSTPDLTLLSINVVGTHINPI